jgi:hypothetical protein
MNAATPEARAQSAAAFEECIKCTGPEAKCYWDAERASAFAALDPAPEVVPAPRVYTPPPRTLLSTALAQVRGLS